MFRFFLRVTIKLNKMEKRDREREGRRGMERESEREKRERRGMEGERERERMRDRER
jgi:hypothetical protein